MLDGSGFAYSYTDPKDAHNLTEKRNAANHLLVTWSYDSFDRCIDNYSVNGNGAAINYVSDNRVDVTDTYGTVRTYTLSEINGQKRVTAMQGFAKAPYDGGNLVRWQYDGSRNLIEVETAGGTFHQYQNHDARGNPAMVILADGEPEERVITYTYHPQMNGALTRSEASVLGAGNKVTIWDYDDDYDLIPNENPTNLISRIIEQGFTKDATGATVPYEYITTLTYNTNGQILTVDGPLAGTADTDAFDYDPVNGNLLSITRPLVGSTSFSNYDAAGKAGRVTDVKSRSETLTYDGRGRITSFTHEADGSSRTVLFDSAGLPNTTTDEDDVSYSYDYDTVTGRLNNKLDWDGNYIEYSYDAQGNLIGRSKCDSGHICTSVKSWDYQGAVIPGLLWKEIKPDGSFTEYLYNTAGNASAVIDFNLNRTDYEYDALNRLVTVTRPGDLITSYDYDLHGNLISVLDAKSHETTFIYDDMGRVLQTTSPDSGTASFAYDEAGNLVQKTDARAIEVSYSYDDLNRLETATGAYGSFSFTYDGVGNRLSRTVDVQTDNYSYITGTNRLDQISGSNAAVFSHDAGGNIIAIDGRTFVYNQNNRLIRVEEGLDILGEYTYNGLGQRQIKEVDGVATVFHYNFDGKIIAESLADGTMTAELIYASGSRLAKVDVATGELYFYLNNYLGTPLLLTDDAGKVVWEADYKPFGEAGVNSNSSVVNDFRFAGQYYDEETGLHYNYYRYYDPATGRYLTPDPIGLLGGMNPYLYVSGNPINLVDPFGLEFSDILPGIKKAIIEGTKGGLYVVGEVGKVTFDIAVNGHPLAQTGLGLAAVSFTAPLAGAAAISATPTAISVALQVAPYSGAIVALNFPDQFDNA